MPSRTGETKPIASSTRSALSVNSLPGDRLHLLVGAHAFEAGDDAVLAAKGAGHHREIALGAFSWLDEVRSFSGQFGQVIILSSALGGIARISSCVTLSAPWRMEVPMQSEPVSPPPITTTFLPAARMRSLVAERLAGNAAVLLRQELHGEMDASEVAAGHGQIARRLGAAGERDRIVGLRPAKRPARRVPTCVIAVEDDALGLHLLDAALDLMLFELEVGDAIAQQAAGLGVLLVDMHLVADAGELLRAGKARRARADDRDPLAGLAASAAPA